LKTLPFLNALGRRNQHLRKVAHVLDAIALTAAGPGGGASSGNADIDRLLDY
jgi:hypothetical protein